jgi:antitoxin CcdA
LNLTVHRRTGVHEQSDGQAATVRMRMALPAALVAEAKALGVNVSRAAEAGLAEAVAVRRQECWLAENDAALASSNAYVEQRGLPLAKHRAF